MCFSQRILGLSVCSCTSASISWYFGVGNFGIIHFPFSASCFGVWQMRHGRHKHTHKVTYLLVTETTLVITSNSQCKFSFPNWLSVTNMKNRLHCVESFESHLAKIFPLKIDAHVASFCYECCGVRMGRFVTGLHLCSHTGLHTHTTHQKHPPHVLLYPWFTTSCLCDCIFHSRLFLPSSYSLAGSKTCCFFLLKSCFVSFHYMQNLINWITGGQQMFRQIKSHSMKA